MPLSPQFRLLVLDDLASLDFLYSCAYTRAVREDLRIIFEKKGGFLPGFDPMRVVGERADRDPNGFSKVVLDHYNRMLSGFLSRLSQGPAPLKYFVDALATQRSQQRQIIQQIFANVQKRNDSLVNFLDNGLKITNAGRALGTVVLAGASAIAAASGSAAATPAALIYLGFKVVKGGVSVATTPAKGWETAQGIAIGNYNNGVISVGEGVQKGTQVVITGLGNAYRDDIARQVKNSRQSVRGLEQQVDKLTKSLIGSSKAKSFKPAAARIGKATYQRLENTRVKLQNQRVTTQNIAAKGATMKGFVTKGMPIVFFAVDAIDAFKEWDETNSQR